MNNRNKGFTLVEFNMASFIALLVFTAAFVLYISVWRSLTTGSAYLDTYTGSRNASGWLIRDVRCAAQVVKQYPETGSPIYQTGDNVIVLRVPSINSSGQVISPGLDYIIYRLQTSDLYRTVKANASSSRPNEDRPIARYCASLTFSSDGVTLSNIPNLSTVNTVAVYLPINKSNVALGETTAEKINPTTIIRLRNK